MVNWGLIEAWYGGAFAVFLVVLALVIRADLKRMRKTARGRAMEAAKRSERRAIARARARLGNDWR